jgi:8-oxo-dGTP diphosphatase
VRLVVGAAVVRDGRLLAARRTAPAEAAGRWELPGGKVEPGESPGSALVREIAEELGCTVAVEHWLDGEQRIGGTHLLRAAVCRLTDADPRPGADHDELRWLLPEQLGEVDWLEPDRPFLVELANVLLDGEVLPGGNLGGAVRVGDTVRRPTGPWTPAVHALVEHVRAKGLRAVPRVHGFDARGREVLDFLPGEIVDIDTELLSEPRLADLGRWTRELHAAVADFEHPGPWRFPAPATWDCVLHNDLGPYNLAFDGDRLSGVFDWDVAGPGAIRFELAWIAWCAVPFFRPIPDEVAVRRLRVLASSYAGPSAAEILAAVPDRIRAMVDGLRAGIEAGDRTLDRLAARDEPTNLERDLGGFLDRLPGVTAALGPS